MNTRDDEEKEFEEEGEEENEEVEEEDEEDIEEEETEFDDTEEDEFEEEETEFEETEEEFSESEDLAVNPEEGKAKSGMQVASQETLSAQPLEKSKAEKVVKPQDIPFDVVVEVGRVRIPLKTLASLKPGNLLNLNVSPESGVDLVVNGYCIGKGELLQVGEVLGVRVLELETDPDHAG